MVCQGLKDGALDWFTSYLSDKSQSVRLRDGQSAFCPCRIRHSLGFSTAAAAVYIIQ